jgi:alpha-mannosidase
VVLTAFKQAEDGQGIIIRFREIEGKKTRFRMELPQLHLEMAYLTNIVEENQEELAIKGHQVELTVGAFAVATIRVVITPVVSKK